MKTRELIARLNELDPSGEMPCVVPHPHHSDQSLNVYPMKLTVYKINENRFHNEDKKAGKKIKVISL